MASFDSNAFLKDEAFSSQAWDFGGEFPPSQMVGGGVGMPKPSYFESQRKRIERESLDELELLQVLTEFLGHQ